MGREFQDEAWLRQEQALLERARQGEQEAMGELYQAFAGPLYQGVLLPRLGDPQAAEDALADTFTAAFQKLHGFESRGQSLWSWLCRIAANKAIDQHRARARTGKALQSYEGLLAPLAPAAGDAEEALARRIDHAELARRVGQTLEQLNPRYCRALQLRFFEGRSRTECAAAMDVRLGTFDVVLLRALRAFRKLWLEGEGEEG